MIHRFTLLTLVIAIGFSLTAGNSHNGGASAPKIFHLAPALKEGKDYLPNTVVLKLKPGYRNASGLSGINIPSVNQLFSDAGMKGINKIFPHHQPPAFPYNRLGQKLTDLSLIYEMKYSAAVPLEKMINQLLNTGVFEYAEPKYIQQLFYTPNDPDLTGNQGQYFIAKIKAIEAWDINKGDTNVVIGIVDTGSDLDHPDLAANLKLNYADPINGIDDDNDGYVDNFHGWDVGRNDNDPTCDNVGAAPFHGSHVSGCADAVTDNGVGVAGPGFKCKFLPVKITDSTGALTKGYEGITYAADHGCSIINCSWGGTGGGQFGQDVMNYAAITKGCAIFAGAGNNNDATGFFPAAFDNVFAVGSTDGNDRKSGFSNYGSYVDFCAPGSNIYETVYKHSYTTSSGTSMASPIAAGAGAIVKSYFPSYNGLQVGEKLRVTADNIDNITGNTGYAGKLGSGRINLYNALTQSAPSVRVQNIVTVDGNDNVFVINDTLRISGNFVNYLDPTVNLTVTLSSTSADVTIINANYSIGALGTLAVANNSSQPFKAIINPSALPNTTVTFKLTYSDGTYNASQTFDVIVNVDYINVAVNDVKTSITSKGRIGFNGIAETEGLGFVYKDSNLVYESGLMIGNSSSAVSDNVRSSPASSTDNDFKSMVAVSRVTPKISDLDLYGKFNDSQASNVIGVQVTHRAFAWNTPADKKYVMLRYVIKNNGSVKDSVLYAGIFSDFDIGDPNFNKGNFDSIRRMGYVYCTKANGLFGGVKVLSNTAPCTHYSIDNNGNGSGGVNMNDGYDKGEKYTTLSTYRKSAGNGTAQGNDVIDVTSSGPFNLMVGDSVEVAFALIAGDNLADIQASADAAQIQYDKMVGIPEKANQNNFSFKVYPNPSNGIATVEFIISEKQQTDVAIYDVTGRRVLTLADAVLSAGNHKLKADVSALTAGIYYCRLTSGNTIATGKIIVVK